MGHALVERASEVCVQVYERALTNGVTDPSPRDFTRELLGLNAARYRNTGHGFPLDVMQTAGWYLIPPSER